MSGGKPSPGVGVFRVLDRPLRIAEVTAAAIGGAAMLIAMVMTSADALLRYGFNAPISFNYHVTEKYLMVSMIALPLAWGFRTGGYIRITMLFGIVPRGTRDLILRVGLVASGTYIGVMAWLTARHWYETYVNGDVIMGVIDWPVSWSWIWVPIGLTLLAARLFLTAIGPAADLHADPENEGHIA
ncbi:MAG: TRAP transporter small permease [Rhodobacteraceae bacterium]|jgi:TRAP-type C4-dicarboxylate transport system permease small subunit|nr:TRAP transporter small permease [Paracoccaceae bacterium]